MQGCMPSGLDSPHHVRVVPMSYIARTAKAHDVYQHPLMFRGRESCLELPTCKADREKHDSGERKRIFSI